MKKVLVFVLVLGMLLAAGTVLAGFCPECGTKCDDSAKFCTSCGAKLKQAEGEGKAEKPSKPGGDADLSKMVEQVAPSVILVRTLKNELNAQFQDRGSGFVVDKEGYIITNAHVIGDPDELEKINVVMSDKKEYEAKLIINDYATDIAVLKIQAANLIPVKLGDAEKLVSGEKVFAVGNPLGLERSTTNGIISAKERYVGCYEYEGLLQTDAAINPGNSGGPLFNMQGEVIGITSLGYSKSVTEGLNLAIPVLYAQDVLKYLKSGKIKRPWIGIAVLDLTPANKQWEESVFEKKITESEGVLVKSIAEDKNLLLKKGDIVVKLNGSPVKKIWDLQTGILKLKIGDEVNLTVKRDGK